MNSSPVFAILVALPLAAGCNRNEPPRPDATVPAVGPAEPGSRVTEAKPTPPDDGPGPAVGEKAPDFRLKDQYGQIRSLEGILESGSAALVFYRSADW